MMLAKIHHITLSAQVTLVHTGFDCDGLSDAQNFIVRAGFRLAGEPAHLAEPFLPRPTALVLYNTNRIQALKWGGAAHPKNSANSSFRYHRREESTILSISARSR